jgi:hypothetical protein
VLKGEKLGPLNSALDVVRSQAHGHLEAVPTAMRHLGFDRLIDAKPERERDLVVAMVVGRIIAPEASKLAMTRAWTAHHACPTRWASPMPTRIACTRPWTGSSSATGRLRSWWPGVI